MWTLMHVVTLIPSIIVMAIIAFVLYKKLSSKDESAKMIPLKIIAVLIVMLEIGKQIHEIVDGYSFRSLPFHYCSLFIFALPIGAFYIGKYKDEVRTFILSICCALLIGMLVIPRTIYNETNIKEFFTSFMSFHTVFFHNLILLYLFIFVLLNPPKLSAKKDILNILVIIPIYCIIGIIMTNIFHANFNNFESCTFGPLEKARLGLLDLVGDYFGQILYRLIVSTTTIVYTFLGYGVLHLTNRFLLTKLDKRK